MTENINWWLMKSEPEAYSIQDLKTDSTTLWDGIRNYQARNFMRSMRKGDKAFFYHSNCKPPGIVGLMEIINTQIVDPTQFEPKSKYYDPKSISNNPRWDCAEVRFLYESKNKLTLKEIREKYNKDDLKLVQKGNRLSIMPVSLTVASELLTQIGYIN